EVHPGTLAFSADAADLPGGAPGVADAGYVVVDAPGLLTAPEPWLVGHYSDAVVLVHPEGISEDELAAAREALHRLGTPVLGAVVAEERAVAVGRNRTAGLLPVLVKPGCVVLCAAWPRTSHSL